MNKFIRRVKGLFMNFPFALKGANDVINGNENKDGASATINQEVSDNRVGKHLLKGELTQEVKDLRYRTYKVDTMAKNYHYLGNGVAVKQNENINKSSKDKYVFTQSNRIVCESVLSSLKQIGKQGCDKYWFEIGYDSCPRYRLEKYILQVDVEIDKGISQEMARKIETTLHFSLEDNPYDASSKAFVNALKAIANNPSEYTLKHNPIISCMNSLSFVTYKATNEEDYVTYSFLGDCSCISIKSTQYEVALTYSWSSFMRLPINLEEKYYSEEMDKKYKENAPKDTPVKLENIERKQYCSICGQEMSTYDADIQKASGYKPICVNCMKQTLNKTTN